MSYSIQIVLNVTLRGITLVSKFVLLFFIARFLEPKDLGVYGLLASSIGYALFFVGFEFYMYSTRELIGSSPSEWGRMIRDQLVFYSMTYAISLAFIVVVFKKEWLPWAFFWWFLILLILEHLAQELNRLLIIKSEQLFASIVLFFRSGFWCLVVVSYIGFVPEHRSVKVILFAWVIGGLLACLVGLIKLPLFKAKHFFAPIDWQWIKKGVCVAFPFLLATLAMRGFFTFDRYWIKSIADLEILGVYVLYIGIANAIISFVDSGVLVFMYPVVISDAKNRDFQSYKKNMKLLFNKTVSVLLILSVFSMVGIHYIVRVLENPIYVKNLIIFYWLIASIAVFTVGLVPQIGLYAFSIDRPIIISHIFGFIFFTISVWLSSGHFGIMSVPYSLFFSLLITLIWKTIAFLRIDKHYFDISL